MSNNWINLCEDGCLQYNLAMSSFLPKSLEDLIDEFSKLPGIGQKTAQRLAIHLLQSPHSHIRPLGDAILGLKDGFIFCSECFHVAEQDPCPICKNPERDKNVLCVVEQILDVIAIEKTSRYKGVYHVLHGALSPIDGVSAEHLKIAELVKRVERGGIQEVILATNPSLEGEATAMYIAKALKSFDIKITRIARGLPVGGDLDYADEITLTRALQGRTHFEM